MLHNCINTRSTVMVVGGLGWDVEGSQFKPQTKQGRFSGSRGRCLWARDHPPKWSHRAADELAHCNLTEFLWFVFVDKVRPKTPPVSISDIQKVSAAVFMVCPQINHYTVCPCDVQPQRDEEEEMSASPGVSEFVSDAFDSTAIDQEDLKKEMEQLVLDKKDSLPSPDGNLPVLSWNYESFISVPSSESNIHSHHQSHFPVCLLM